MSRRKVTWTEEALPGLADVGRPADPNPIPDHLEAHVEHCIEETCPIPIVFAVTKAGARAPVDAHPNPKGNLRVNVHNNTLHMEVVRIADRVEGEPLHLSHFSSCTNPSRFRKTPQQPPLNR